MRAARAVRPTRLERFRGRRAAGSSRFRGRARARAGRLRTRPAAAEAAGAGPPQARWTFHSASPSRRGLEPLLLRRPDVARGQPGDDRVLVLGTATTKSGAPGVKAVPSRSVPVRLERRGVSPNAPDGPEHRRQCRERIDAHVDDRADRVQAARIWVPPLDPVPVRLRVDRRTRPIAPSRTSFQSVCCASRAASPASS